MSSSVTLPAKIPAPFAWNAASGQFRTIPATSADPNAASYSLGFPPNTFVDVGAGGEPPDGRDFNGILNITSAWAQYQAAGGAIKFDGAFAAVISGYPAGAVLQSSGGTAFYINTVNGNSTDPDSATAAGWFLLTRKRLQAALNLYVASTGSDTANTGLTIGSPFLTLNHAVAVLQNGYDLAGFSAQINLADGTYSGATVLTVTGSFVGAAGNPIAIVGNVGTPGNVILSASASSGLVSVSNNALVTLTGVKFAQTGTGNNAVQVGSGGNLTLSAVDFGAFAAGSHMVCTGGTITLAGNYTISGGASFHVLSGGAGAAIVAQGAITATLSGTPAFSGAFAQGQYLGEINMGGVTYSGSATGVRYAALMNAIILTNGGGANFFPGNSAGSTATGGQYS